MVRKRLGDVLTERGKISQEDLDRALATQQEKTLHLGELLLDRGLVSKTDIGRALEEVNRVRYAECPPPAIKPGVLALLPPEVASRCCALPLELDGKRLVVAMAEPQNLELLDQLRFSTGMDIAPRFSFRSDVREGIRKFYGEQDEGKTESENEETALKLIRDTDISQMEFLTVSSRESSREALKELQAGMKQRTPAVRMVSSFLAAAADKGASDLHIEPYATGATVRLRVDGLLRELGVVPANQQAAVASRIKILADMDIAERRVPQDGRFLMQYRGHRLDLRVSTLPTHFGEKVVVRLLDPASTRVSLKQLGLSSKAAETLTRLLALPQGMLLVTGPTGSGKSTTLYSALNLLRSPDRNIITVEDPIEYMLEGISQVQVHPQAGRTFANSLRSMLRQDPDVIMVGEIRDGETAEIAMKAVQTGHFVLSTLHTNDCVAAINRLVDLDVPPYLIASSVTAVMAQRLVRKLCDCRRESPATPEYMDRLLSLNPFETRATLHQPVGCPDCDQAGYKGRVGIFELLLLEEPLREAIHQRSRPEEIRRIARAGGFKNMQETALEKVSEGLTTLEEVLRVVPCETSTTVRCDACGRELMPAFLYCPFCGTFRSEAALAGEKMATLSGGEKS